MKDLTPVRATVTVKRYRRKQGVYIRGFVNVPMSHAKMYVLLQCLVASVKRVS